MIVAASITALGFFAVAAITQIYGYRLSGTITIPVLTVYALKNALIVPIFAFSTILSYVGLKLLKDRTLLYGRDELLAAIVIGSGVPLGVLLALGTVLSDSHRAVLFIGSILPGLAAFNYHQLKPVYRKWDFATTTVLFAVLVALGALLVSPALKPLLGTVTPPILYGETADIAHWREAVVTEPIQPMILDRPSTVGILGLALVASEALRRRYDVRIGVVAVGLLALYALSSVWLIALYVVLLAVMYAAVEAVHRNTILYGRVLIGLSAGISLLAALPLVVALPVENGLSAYFVAIFAGINAYSMHVTAPRYRILIPPLQTAAFLVLLGLARAVTDPFPRGFPQELSVTEVVAGAVVVAACVGFAELYTVKRPSDEAVYRESILSGGGEA